MVPLEALTSAALRRDSSVRSRGKRDSCLHLAFCEGKLASYDPCVKNLTILWSILRLPVTVFDGFSNIDSI
jgi:hypothetical protein